MPAQGSDRRVRTLQRLVTAGVAQDLTDRELLQRFSSLKDEGAFEVLVSRHGMMVRAVARRLLENAHDAEDVCQAAFLLLAQKAGTGRWQPSVANWLYQTAHHLSLKVRTANLRRDRRQKNAINPPAKDPLTEMTARELLTVLDEELLALPETLRTPLVHCYLEGATQDEAAKRMQCSVHTVKKRLERGRLKLSAALARRGIGFSAALAGTLAAQCSLAGIPASLARGIVRSAKSLADGCLVEAAVPQGVRQLLNGAKGMTSYFKIKVTLSVLFLMGVIAVGATLAGGREAEPREAKAARAETIESPPAPPTPAGADDKSAPPKETRKSIKVSVVDQDGKPVKGAGIHASVWTEEKDFKKNQELQTNGEGIVDVELPKTFTILRLWASKDSFVTLFANWEQGEVVKDGVPAAYKFHLEPSVTAGGRVVDEEGKPIVGARVAVSLAREHVKPRVSDGRVAYSLSTWGEYDPKTDAEGRWKIDGVPNHPNAQLWVTVRHADFIPEERGRMIKVFGETDKSLRDGNATTSLKKGVVLRGQVTDPDGKPIKDAVVVLGNDPYWGHATSTFATDAEGRYRLPALAPGQTSVTVIAPGLAPQLRKVDAKPDTSPQDFRLMTGKAVRLVIRDGAGKPLPKAWVTLLEWNGSKSIYSMHNPNHPKVPGTGIPDKADDAGVWEWKSAPDEPVKVSVSVKGYAVQELDVVGGAAERVVTLKLDRPVTGAVVDAVTGKPIPAFRAVQVDVFGKDFLVAERERSSACTNGRLVFDSDRTDVPLRIRVEAPGYRSQMGPEFRRGEGKDLVQNFRLDPSPPMTGIVLDGTGKPAAKLRVLLATATEQVSPAEELGNNATYTDETGRFSFPDPGEPWAVAVREEAGTLTAEFSADQHDAGTLRLQPWGTVRGTFHDGGKPVAGATVYVSPIRLDRPGSPKIEDRQRVQTDSEGRFEFKRVAPGANHTRIYIGPWKDEGFRSGPSVPFELKPGGGVDLNLGSGGTVVSGKVKLTGKIPPGLDCAYSLNELVRREPGVSPPPGVAQLGFDVRKGWNESWGETPEGRCYVSTLQTWHFKLTADGSFRISGVPAGEYDLVVAVYAKPEGCLVDPLARQRVPVTVTAEDVARGELKIPEISAEVRPVPGVGDIPEVSYETPDGKTGTLESVRGKYSVVHFGASWCVACKKQLPDLRKLMDRFAAKEVTGLGLMIDDNATLWRETVKGLALPWPQGRVEVKNLAGVSSVPMYWLLDPKGKIVCKVYDVEELTKELEKQFKK